MEGAGRSVGRGAVVVLFVLGGRGVEEEKRRREGGSRMSGSAQGVMVVGGEGKGGTKERWRGAKESCSRRYVRLQHWGKREFALLSRRPAKAASCCPPASSLPFFSLPYLPLPSPLSLASFRHQDRGKVGRRAEGTRGSGRYTKGKRGKNV